MELIECKRPDTKAAINCFLCRSSIVTTTKKIFFERWAISKTQNDAAIEANYWDCVIAGFEEREEDAFDNMLGKVMSETLDYPFLSTEWNY